MDDIVEAPVACTLGPADLRAQVTRWEDLLTTVLVERSPTADGLRVSFRGEPGIADEVRALVRVETDCCRWARWSVRERDGTVVLTVRSAGEGVAALHAMFTGG
jgi:hypothetical protein